MEASALQHVDEARELLAAFLMGFHDRLGRDSPIATLDPFLVREIAEVVLLDALQVHVCSHFLDLYLGLDDEGEKELRAKAERLMLDRNGPLKGRILTEQEADIISEGGSIPDMNTWTSLPVLVWDFGNALRKSVAEAYGASGKGNWQGQTICMELWGECVLLSDGHPSLQQSCTLTSEDEEKYVSHICRRGGTDVSALESDLRTHMDEGRAKYIPHLLAELHVLYACLFLVYPGNDDKVGFAGMSPKFGDTDASSSTSSCSSPWEEAVIKFAMCNEYENAMHSFARAILPFEARINVSAEGRVVKLRIAHSYGGMDDLPDCPCEWCTSYFDRHLQECSEGI